MNIEDFLPKYPNINKKDEKILNPYEDNFYSAIFKKREFYDERLPVTEPFPTERGMLMKQQKIIARFLSSHTMYDVILIVHEMGSGKSCTAIGAIEQIKNEDNNFKGVYIFAKGTNLLNNFKKELRDKCTGGQYIPEGHIADEDSGCGKTERKRGGLTQRELVIRTKKLYENFYHFTIGERKPTTFETFAKHLKRASDADIISMYSNHIIVIDEVHNLRIQDVTEDGKISMYKQFHRFLHLVKNCKILLLSGTPMKDTPDEIASVMNLILPLNKQLPTGERFISKYLNRMGPNKYTIKKNKIKSLKKHFKGRVSFLKAMKSEVKKEFMGRAHMGKLDHFIVEPVKMSKFQSKVYQEALELDSKGKAGVYLNSRQASLFVFPDGSYGQPKSIEGKEQKAGFLKYVERKRTSRTFLAAKLNDGKTKKKHVYKYTLSPGLVRSIRGSNNKETLKNLRKYSAKYAYVIENILDAKGKSCFVYSEFVTGSGAILFTKILELFGFSSSKGLDGDRKGLRYGLLTHKTATPTQISQIINCFNQPSNMNGEIIKVLIGSRVVSEGVSFYNVQKEYILTPWYNYSETDQAIARGYRLGSHKMLLDSGQTPKVEIYLMVAMPRKRKVISVDLYMYEISEDKDIIIRAIMRLLMEAAFDCSLNYLRNHESGEDGKRGCEYTDCDYVCDGIDMKNIEDGLPIEEIDNSTYQLYYADPKVLPIRKKLEKYFRTYNDSDIKSIFNFLGDEYTEWEIRNALKTIIKRSGENLYYADYIDIYSRSTVKKIILGIQKLFQNHFRLNFDYIASRFANYTPFEVLTALKNTIDESIIIQNKYGFSSYLREHRNVYFLVNNLSITDDLFSDYYSRIPNITNDETFEDTLHNIQITLLPTFIERLCEIKKKTRFFKLMGVIPIEIQELFIESAIRAEKQNISTHQLTRKMILEYFVNYIHQINDIWFSNRLGEQEEIRCLIDDEWEDCDEKLEEQLSKHLRSRKSTLQNNPYGYYGIYNPETNTFSIVNLVKQNEARAKKREKKIRDLTKLVKSGKISEEEKEVELQLYEDARVVYPGKNCRQGWDVPLLLKIALRSLELDYPDDFKSRDPTNKIRQLVSKNKYLGVGSKKYPPIYSAQEIKEMKRDDLRRALYWGTNRPYVEKLCVAMEQWFRNKTWNGFEMLIPDRQAGTSGGHDKIDKSEKKEKKLPFHLVRMVPENTPNEFKAYTKQIEKLYSECFGIKKYRPEVDSKRWFMVFLRKKMVAFLTSDTKNINVIDTVCVAENYRRRGIAKDALAYAVNKVWCPVNPRLMVDNREKMYNKLLKLYKKYGFTVTKNDGKITTLEFKCS